MVDQRDDRIDANPSLDAVQALKIIQEVEPSSALFERCRKLLDGNIEIESSIPKATIGKERRFLTIGMATHDDYDGCYFSVQCIRLYHPEILQDAEILVLDNNPAGPCAKVLKALESWAPQQYRYLPYAEVQGTAVRDLIFREAAGDFVLCMDSHVLFAPGSLARLVKYCRQHPQTNDLLQGPVLWDDLNLSTHFDPRWEAGMYGYWELDARGKELEAPPFEIPMQGLGCSPAAAKPGRASIRAWLVLAVRRDTFTRKSGGRAGAISACRSFAGCTGSIGPREFPTCATGKTESGII